MLAALIALALPGCEKPTSNLDARSPGGRIMYPITAEQADSVLFSALRSTAPEADVFEAINLGAATLSAPLPLANN